MNILLINPPIRLHTPAYIRPFGLAIMAQMLMDAGHYVEIYDINSLRHTREEVVENLPRKNWDIVGAGGLITTYKYMLFLVPLLRQVYKDVPIIIGGGGITSAPEVHMENLRPDYGAVGEGEYTILELASGMDCRKIDGLVYYEDEELVFNPPRQLEKDLDKFPWKAYSLLDIDKYAEEIRHDSRSNRELGVIATRGCPMSCTFCYHIFGRRMRYRSVDNVLDEIEYLVDNHDIETIMFCDELFTANRDYVHEFCEKIMKRKLGVAWSCFSRVDTLDEETMRLMSWAGCWRVGFGIESGSQKILDEMNKGATVEQAAEAYKLADKYFRQVGVTFIYGMPGEDRKTLSENVMWCEGTGISGAFYHINPYPGTKLYEDVLDKILAKYGSEHEFFRALDDAGQFVINLTNFTDDAYFRFKYIMEREMHHRALQIRAFKIGDGVPPQYVKSGRIFCVHPKHITVHENSSRQSAN